MIYFNLGNQLEIVAESIGGRHKLSTISEMTSSHSELHISTSETFAFETFLSYGSSNYYLPSIFVIPLFSA